MSVYQEITDRFLAEIQKGVIPWRRPWTVGKNYDWAYSHATGKPYSFLNAMMCGVGEFVTFPGAKKEGGHINKGAKSRRVFVPMVFTPASEKDKPEDEQEQIFTFRRISVFSLADTTGLEYKIVEPPKLFDCQPVEAAELVVNDYVKRAGLKIRRDQYSKRAAYCEDDVVVCPMREQFEDVSEYYSALFHELAHSTGAATRLNRVMNTDKKSDDYAKEELVAEFTATIILRKLGLDAPRTWQNSASYLDFWASAFKNNAKMITWAAGKADKAAALILGKEEKEAA